MKERVRKFINFRVDRFKDIEMKLEKLATKGLFLEECGPYFWTFRRGEPRELKYTITYFSEGSIFNPDITDNQQTYFDYAQAAGWNFVTQLNQMQIFCSEAKNPIPFETDEKEKLENIKKCMRKTLLPSALALLLVVLINLVTNYKSFQLSPIDFLANPAGLLLVLLMVSIVLYEVYFLLDYFIWCKRSEHAIAQGGGCVENSLKVRRIIDIIFLSIAFGSLGYFLIYLTLKMSWFLSLLALVQIPLLMLLFWSSIKYLKKIKASPTMNKVISITLLVIAHFAYFAILFMLLVKLDFTPAANSDYRTVSWSVTATTQREYKLYNEDIPLTCEDLYGNVDYDYYSYEKDMDSTFFLRKVSYRQDPLPAKDAPPRLTYLVLEPHFDFVYDLAKKELLKTPEWRDNVSFKTIDKEIFEAVEAYQEYYGDNPTGRLVLFFEDKILMLNMEEPPTTNQITVIREKLRI